MNALLTPTGWPPAPVDKARVSAHLTLFEIAAGTLGALAAGRLGDLVGLRDVVLLWLLPRLAAWLGYHLRAGSPTAVQGGNIK